MVETIFAVAAVALMAVAFLVGTIIERNKAARSCSVCSVTEDMKALEEQVKHLRRSNAALKAHRPSYVEKPAG